MKAWHALIPRPVVRATYNARNRVRAQLLKRVWKLVDLDYTLAPLTVRIESRSDWIVYNEIFVKRVYDPAFYKALELSDRPSLTVLDLGANVGFFALRVAYLMAKDPSPRGFDMTLVEGSPLVFRELRSRVEREPFLKDRVATVCGLVGEREGSAKIFESASLGANNSLFATRIPQGVEVPYVDLSRLFDNGTTIDLLKCDIEGSELSFLQNYRDLLPRVRVAVFEFHPDVCDVERCLEILAEAGFRNREDLRHVQLFWK